MTRIQITDAFNSVFLDFVHITKRPIPEIFHAQHRENSNNGIAIFNHNVNAASIFKETTDDKNRKSVSLISYSHDVQKVFLIGNIHSF